MSESIVFEGYGMTLLRRNGQFIIRYDAGELVDKIEEIEVSEQEAQRAMRSERDAYEVILAHQLSRGS